jgi:hypothetical protein
MHRMSFRKKGEIRPAVLSLLILLSFFIIPGLTVRSRAQGVYSAKEQIYLKNITPLLYEFSQVASDVSASVLTLQSSPPEVCSSKFADYRGIVGSLSGQLGSMTPPPRLETVHSYAMQALDGYSKGLGLYYNACTEEDYGVKESLVSQGGVYLNKSVGTVGKAYAEIENLKSAGPPVAKEESSEQITEGEITEGMTSADTGAETQGRNTAAPNPPVRQAKSKEQVLAEISEKVQADMEAEEAAENAPSETDSAESEPPPVQRRDVVSTPEPSKEKTKITTPEKTESPVVKASEPTAEPTPVPPPPTEAPSLKSEEEPSPVAASTGEENVEPQAGEGEESKVPEEKESGKGKIEKLNQKIMEQTNAGQESKAVDETVPAEVGTESNQPADKAAETASPPAVQDSDVPQPGGPAPGENNQEVAVVPPGGTAEELKEEEVPGDDIKSWCQERYEIQTEREDCMKHRAVAKDKIDKLSGSYSGGTKEREVLDKCMSDWKEGGTYNYEMVISCTQFFCTQRGIEDCKDLSK